MKTPIYLDNGATTALDPAVLAAMLPILQGDPGNPSSTAHPLGQSAARVAEEARETIASALGGAASEVLFTSGATESINLALVGTADRDVPGRRKIVTWSTEHRAVLEPVAWLGRQGFETLVLDVDRVGRIDLDALDAVLDERTLLVSVLWGNNEIGTLSPVAEIARRAHRVGAVLHCDAAQALGKVPVDVSCGVDLLSISAHKMHGPVGIGVLWVRGIEADPPPLVPRLLGGGQERGLRPGTLNVAGAVGLAEAVRSAEGCIEREGRPLAELRDRLEQRILDSIPDVSVNGDREHRLPQVTSLTIPGAHAESLMLAVPEVAFSAGSACATGSDRPSHVLRALGMSDADASCTVRLVVSRFTAEEEVDRAVELLGEGVKKLRGMG